MSFVNIIIDDQFIEFSQIFNLLSYYLYSEYSNYNIKELNYIDDDNVPNDDNEFLNEIIEFQSCQSCLRPEYY